MKSGKHIVWLTPGFASSEADDYTTPTLQNLARAINQNYDSIRLTIVTIHFPYEEGRGKWNGIDVINVGAANISYPKRFFSWRKVLRVLRELHRAAPIDFVNSFWYSESALLADRFCKREGVPHVCTIMGQDAQQQNKYILLLRRKQINTIAISDRCAKDFQEATGNKVDHVIPFGLESMNSPLDDVRTIDIIGVGTLTAPKRFERFISIIALVKNKLSTLKVVILGEGPERRKLQALVHELQLDDTIEFKGLVTRQEVLHTMRLSKVFLHAAVTEGMGYVYLEAAASGCYIVSTPAGIIKSDEYACVSDSDEEMAERIIAGIHAGAYPSRIAITVEKTAEEYVALYSNFRNL